jgi:hypothetical protein
MTANWTASPDLRLRPVPELACCLVYVPRPPALHGLNLTSWLVLSLCDGRDEAAIAKEYFELVTKVGGPGTARNAVEGALLQLEELRLVRRTTSDEPV